MTHSSLTRKLIRDGLAPAFKLDRHGPLRLLTEAEGYVMVRRARAKPFVMSRQEWDALDVVRAA